MATERLKVYSLVEVKEYHSAWITPRSMAESQNTSSMEPVQEIAGADSSKATMDTTPAPNVHDAKESEPSSIFGPGKEHDDLSPDATKASDIEAPPIHVAPAALEIIDGEALRHETHPNLDSHHVDDSAAKNSEAPETLDTNREHASNKETESSLDSNHVDDSSVLNHDVPKPVDTSHGHPSSHEPGLSQTNVNPDSDQADQGVNINNSIPEAADANPGQISSHETISNLHSDQADRGIVANDDVTETSNTNSGQPLSHEMIANLEINQANHGGATHHEAPTNLEVSLIYFPQFPRY